jgi:hypothetical protein
MDAIVRADLLTDISEDELAGLAEELLSTGQTTPIEKEIAESLSIIKLYVDPYLLRDDIRRRLWRLLTITGLYNRLGRIPDKRVEEREWCLETLKDIRDGKFSNLVVDPESDTPALNACGGFPRRRVY